MSGRLPGRGLRLALRIGIILFIITALLVWLIFGEPGVSGRFNTLGFAFCHQLPTRTPSFGGVACPLCYRCSGLFFGIAVGFFLFCRRAVSFRSLLGPAPMIGAISAIVFYAFDGVKNLNRSPLLSGLYPDRPILRCLSGFGLGVWVGLILTLMLREFIRLERFSAGRRIGWHDLLIALCLSVVGAYLLLSVDPRWIPIQRVFGLTLGLIPVTVTGTLFFVLVSGMDRLVRFAGEPLPVWDRVLGAAALTALFIGSIIVFRYQVTGGWIREINVLR